jgi:hypothetical protein
LENRGCSFLLEFALTTLLLGAQLVAQPVPAYHIEREPVADGLELVTVFAHQSDPRAEATDVPLLSVLRDTLGDNDPQNDRLRYLWVLTSTPPTPLQRIAFSVVCLLPRGKPAARRSRAQATVELGRALQDRLA